MPDDLVRVSYPFAVFLVAKGIIPRRVSVRGDGDGRHDYIFHTEDVAIHKAAFARVLTLLKPEGKPEH